MVSTADAHAANDPEFKQWPPHCVAGTAGQRKPPETILGGSGQILIEKQAQDCFSNPDLPGVLERLGADATLFEGGMLHRGRGCQECHDTGYRGRIGVFEMIRVNEPIRELVMRRPAGSQIRKAAGEDFIGMRQDGYRKVLAGVTSLEEVWRVTQDAEENGLLAPLEI